MNTPTNEWDKVPGSDLPCSLFRWICFNALKWHHETEQLPEPKPSILSYVNLMNYMLFQIWLVEYEVYGEEGENIVKAYYDAFELQYPDLLKEFFDPCAQERWFMDWFVDEAYHTHPPLAREELVRRAKRKRG